MEFLVEPLTTAGAPNAVVRKMRSPFSPLSSIFITTPPLFIVICCA
mgnify:CR=1 FL=1